MEYGRAATRLPKSNEDKEKWQRLIIILEGCPLKATQTDRGFELTSERHRGAIMKRGEDPAIYRPDVVHQCLLHLQDSPLNRAAKLQVYVKTRAGVLIMVDPRLRVPRSYRLFEKMMVHMFHKLKIRATNGYLNLLKVVKNPVTDHIPSNARIIRVEKGATMVNPMEFCGSLPEGKGAPPVVFVVGGMSKGDVEVDYAHESVAISERGLSAAAVCSVLCHGMERKWEL
jgi:rRNA small subunit pseudouridine methyltransferase Nep1